MIPMMQPQEPIPIYSAQFIPDIFEKLEPQIPQKVSKLPIGDLLLKYQQNAIKALDENDVVFVEKSRRIGLTWGMASHAALTAAASKSAGGMDVLYMGYEKEMAREFIDVVGKWAKAFNIVASEVEEFVFEEGKDADKEIKAFRIQFASGFEVIALPSKPRSFRGKQGLVILDEAAFMDKIQETIDAAMALLMWGGQVMVISTHYGEDNPFNEWVKKIKDDPKKPVSEQTGYKLISITFSDAIADGLYERIKLCSRKKMLPKAEWIADIRKKYGAAAGQELDCIPSVGGEPWLTKADIEAAIHPDTDKPELYTKNICFMGYDVARRRDYSVIVTFEKVGEILWLRKLWFERAKTFDEQFNEFGSQIRYFKVGGAGVDQTGMGEKVVEDLQKLYGTTLVHGILMTGPNRLDLAVELRTMFETGKIRISNDNELRADLLALKRAGRDGKALMETSQKHADIFWALAFAVRVMRLGYSEYGYQSANAHAANDDDDDDDLAMFGHPPKMIGGMTRHGMSRNG